MAPSARTRPSPYDRFTDASPSAVASGFSAAMALGPQPKLELGQSEGASWLRNLQEASGINGEEFPLHERTSGVADGIVGSGMGEDEDLSEEDDGDGDDDGIANGGKKKVKKGKARTKAGKGTNEDSTAAQRKAQNRIAQREFRQRKQQYIRALEARVELLSSDHDTQVNRLRYALRGLLAENNQLRSLLGCTTAFIGTEMIGGPLQKAGMSRKELEFIISNSSEKTMTESWENWPGARECEALRQIRFESNLPPEGLPESHRYNTRKDHNQVSAAAGPSSSKTTDETDGPNVNKASPPKRKFTADDAKNGKRKHAKSNENLSQSVISPASHLTTSDAASSPQNYPRGPDAAAFVDFLSQSASILPNNFVDLKGNTDSTDGLIAPFQSASSGDSNAILASLFGVNGVQGLGDFFNQTSMSMPLPLTINPIPDNTSGPRQKTVANVEEPEEIKRINVMAAKLLSGETPYGVKKEKKELSEAVDGISQLIHQMATFRRQPSYQLPLLLESSDIQQTRPHDPIIDSLPFSGLRQRLIVLQDSLNMDNILLSFLYHVKLHTGNALTASNWELKDGFFQEHRQVIDKNNLQLY